MGEPEKCRMGDIMDKFGWAYIGCGGIAHTTAKELIKTDDQQIVAVWNRTYEKAGRFAKKYGGTAYKTAEEAINAPGVEGVYIALTADKHAEFMRLCIKHHKPVLCEKPFTVMQRRQKRSSPTLRRKKFMFLKRCGLGIMPLRGT